MHATEYHSQKMMANVIVGGGGGIKARWLNWNYCIATLLVEPPLIFLSEEEKRWLCLNHIKPLGLLQPKLLDQSILFSLFQLVFLSVASVYWQTNGYNQASCSKCSAITVVSKQVSNHQSSAIYLTACHDHWLLLTPLASRALWPVDCLTAAYFSRVDCLLQNILKPQLLGLGSKIYPKLSQQPAVHAQWRSFSIHAESFQVC